MVMLPLYNKRRVLRTAVLAPTRDASSGGGSHDPCHPEGHGDDVGARPGHRPTEGGGRDRGKGGTMPRGDCARSRTRSSSTPLRRPLGRAIRFCEAHGFCASGTVSDFFGMERFEYVKALGS